MKRHAVLALLATTIVFPLNADASRQVTKVSVTPSEVEVGKQTTFHFRTSPRTVIRFDGTSVRSNRRGRASLTLVLPESGTYPVRAKGARAAVVAKDPPTPEAPTYSESFDGDCDFSGAVHFEPLLTNTPQTIVQSVPPFVGKCSGTFTDARRNAHAAEDVPVMFQDTSVATDSSCLTGTAAGAGTLTFPWGVIDFKFHEDRVAALPIITLTGASGGRFEGPVTASQSNDPAIAAQCNGDGLEKFAFDAHLSTNPDISG